MLSPLSMKFLTETSALCNDKQHTPVLLLLCIKHWTPCSLHSANFQASPGRL